MIRYIILISFITHFSLSQDSGQLRDSIKKYKHINPSLALEFGLEFNDLILNRKPDIEIQQVLGAMGEILSTMGLHATALGYLNRSIKIYETLPEKERKFPEVDQPPGVLLVIGNIYYSNREYDKADEIFTQTISLYEKISDQKAKIDDMIVEHKSFLSGMSNNTVYYNKSKEEDLKMIYEKITSFSQSQYGNIDFLMNISWDSYNTFVSAYDTYHYHTFVVQVKVKNMNRNKFLEVYYNPVYDRVTSDFIWDDTSKQYSRIVSE